MLRMHEDGLIQLPPPLKPSNNETRRAAIAITSATDPQDPKESTLKDLGKIELKVVSSTTESRLWNEYVHRYHYLGYQSLPGAQLRYIARVNDQVIALLGFGAAAWKTAPRDRFIGWSSQQRAVNLHLVVNNARFLILPWIKVPHLASKLLAMAARRISGDWETQYNYRPVLLETFVETARFAGTCYRAANWTHHGNTQGRGKLDVHHRNDKPVKSVWTYPLQKNAIQLLRTG